MVVKLEKSRWKNTIKFHFLKQGKSRKTPRFSLSEKISNFSRISLTGKKSKNTEIFRGKENAIYINI
ncbi:hypothetical protein A7W90_16130 [Clostridium sp. Bc-iso-3]|nr:hypothetical protein A7W90_16130 [Clostridium sp. Bc-iso-3]